MFATMFEYIVLNLYHARRELFPFHVFLELQFLNKKYKKIKILQNFLAMCTVSLNKVPPNVMNV